jgi:hypothetical protein
MKTLFTSLMILMVNFAIAQAPLYTYNDGVGNKYELYASYIKRMPVAANTSSTIGTKGTTTVSKPEKTIEITKDDLKDVTTLFQAAIDANATQAKLNTLATIEYLFDRNNKTIYLKATQTDKVALQTKLENILSR